MRRKVAVGLLLCAVCCQASENELTVAERLAGWILLFDGKTMEGWDNPAAKSPAGSAWVVADGCLKAEASPRITEDLFTRRTFRNFDLTWEWRISPKGNSGIKYRIQKHFFVLDRLPGEKFEKTIARSLDQPLEGRQSTGQDYVVGFEYQITDNQMNSDALSNPKHTAGALYDIATPEHDATNPVGEWNQSRIVVQGFHVEHWLNGAKVVDTYLNSPEARSGIGARWTPAPAMVRLLTDLPVKDCPISLQNHGDEAWFRSIRVRELP